MAATAFLEVTFTKNLAIKPGNTTDLSNNFDISNNGVNPSVNIPIQSATINGNKVRLEIAQSDVPKPGHSLTVTYTDSPTCSLVDSGTGFPLGDLTSVKDASQNRTVNPPLPEVISAVVNHENPKQIRVNFTSNREIDGNSESVGGTAGYGFTPSAINTSGAYNEPTWGGTAAAWAETPYTAGTELILTNSSEIQFGMNVSMALDGNKIADQFDLSANNATISVTNNVKKILLDNAYVSQFDPSSVICYFKAGDISGVNMKVLNYFNPPTDIYKVKMNNVEYDVSGVNSVAFSGPQCSERGIPNKYADISGIKFSLNAFPFQYNKDISVYWDTPEISDPQRLKDSFGNEIFASGFEPVNDASFVAITSNTINGITVKESTLVVNDGVGEDLSYNVILSFITESDSVDISGSLVNENVSDFTITNSTTGKTFNPDGIIELEDPSRVRLHVDYNTDNFDKIINKGDNVSLSYVKSEWPSSIKDNSGNFMLPRSNMSMTNSMDLSGDVIEQSGYKLVLGASNDTLELAYNVDICLNYVDASDNIYNSVDTNSLAGFTVSVDDPTGVEIEKITKGDSTNNAIIHLNKPLYAISVVSADFSNSNSVTRNKYGLKLNTESGLEVDLSGIPAPGNSNKWAYNSGYRNSLGVFDVSFNPPLDTLGDGSGFKYKAEYPQVGSLYTHLQTNGFVDIPSSNVSMNSDGSIRLITGFNSSNTDTTYINNPDQSGPNNVRGFSKTHTAGGSGYGITFKYVETNGNNTRPSGPLGYLPDFEISVADSSNNILDPSGAYYVSLTQNGQAYVFTDKPNVVYVAIKQPAYFDESGHKTIGTFDVSGIDISGTPPFVGETSSQGNFSDIGTSTSDITTITGLNIEHEENTHWVVVPLDMDINGNISHIKYTPTPGNVITDQNGGVVPGFDRVPITDQSKFYTLGAGLGFGGAELDSGYPLVKYDSATNEYDEVYVRWTPNFTDFGSTPVTSWEFKYIDSNGSVNEITPSSQSWVSGTENSLVLTFSQNLNPTGSSGHQLKYTKPVGVQSSGFWGGVKLGDTDRRWLKSFSYQNATIEDVPNLVNAFYYISGIPDSLILEPMIFNFGTDLSENHVNLYKNTTAFKDQFMVRVERPSGTFTDISGSDLDTVGYAGGDLQMTVNSNLFGNSPPVSVTVSYTKSSNEDYHLLDVSNQKMFESNPTNLPATIPPTMLITAIDSSSNTLNSGGTIHNHYIDVTFTCRQGTYSSLSAKALNFTVNDITLDSASTFVGGTFQKVSDSVYTVQISPTVGTDNAHTINVSSSVFTDEYGVNNGASQQFNWSYDGTGPFMDISASAVSNFNTLIADGSTTNDSTLYLKFTSSEPTSDFTIADISVNYAGTAIADPTAGTPPLLSNFTTVSSTVYTVELNTSSNATGPPAYDGSEYQIQVIPGSFTDSPGNPALSHSNVASRIYNWTFDNTAPVFSSVSLNTTSYPYVITVTIADPVYSADDGATQSFGYSDFDIQISGGSLTATNPGSGFSHGYNSGTGITTFTIPFNTSSPPDGTETVTINPAASTSIYDSAGNAASTSQTVTTAGTLPDETAPVITSTVPDPFTLDENVSAGSSIGYTVTATDAVGVTGFTISDTANFSISSGGVITINNSPDYENTSSYTFTVAAQDAAGNSSSTQSVTLNINDLDEVAPTLSNIGLTSDNSSSGYAIVGKVVKLSFTADESISTPTVTFQSGGVNVNGTINVSNTSGNNYEATYTVNSGDTNGSVTFEISNYQDNAGNSGASVTSVTDGSTMTVDKTVPTISSTSIASNNSITVTFSEDVYKANTGSGGGNLEVSDFSLSITQNGGTATLHSATPSSISQTSQKIWVLTPDWDTQDATGVETLTVTPVASSIYDIAGNAASTTQSNNTQTLNDTTAPASFTVGSVVTTGGTVVTNYWNSTNTGLTITVPIANDSSLDGGTLQLRAKAGSNSYEDLSGAYTIGSGDVPSNMVLNIIASDVEGITGYAEDVNLTFTATITDDANNATTGTESSNVLHVDETAPSITSITPGWGEYLNATEDDSNGTVTVVTSGAENGQTVTLTLNAQDYTGSVSSDSTSITVPANYLQSLTDGTTYDMSANVSDAAGNAATQFTTSAGNGQFTVDKSAPTAAITYSPEGPYKQSDSVTITATFNEDILDSPIMQIAIAGSGIAGLTATNMTKSSSTVYTYNYSVPTGDGTGTITISTGTDLAGNEITAAPSNNTFTVDNTAPAASAAPDFIALGGTVVSGYWNSTNTDLSLNVAIANDSTLDGGELQLKAQVDSEGFEDLSGVYAITTSDINSNKYFTITAADFEALSSNLQLNEEVTFRVDISDNVGNFTQGTASTDFMVFDETPPTIGTFSYSTFWGEYLNRTNTGEDGSPGGGTITIPVTGASGEKLSITLNGTTKESSTILTNSSTSAIVSFSATDLQLVDGQTYDMSANISDIAGNAATEVVSQTFTVDRTAPTITSVKLIEDGGSANAKLEVTFSEDVYDNYVFGFGNASGALETHDFSMNIVGGTAVLASGGIDEPSAVDISNNGTSDISNVWTLTIPYDTMHTADGSETLRVDISGATSIYDIAGNAASTTQSNNTVTLYDETAPTLSSVSIASSNGTTTLAKASDVITLTITSSENISTPTVTMSIGGGSNVNPTVSGSGTSWTATHTVVANENGSVTFEISNYQDSAGNSGASVTSGTGSVTVDTTAPALTQVTAIATPSNDTTPEYVFTSDEAGTLTSTLGFSSSSSITTGSNQTVTFNTLTEGTYSNQTITVTDAAGNASSLTIPDFVIDTTAPTVLDVSSTAVNGTYKIGDVIPITVQFDESVIVDTTSGFPSILLETGTTDGGAIYDSGSGSSILTFNYTVGVNNVSSDLEYNTTSTISLPTGVTIKDAAGNDATLTLPTIGGGNSLSDNKNIVIDGVRPIISSSAWETQVYDGSSWSNKTTSNGQGSDADIIYTEERFIFYIQASETLDSSTPIVDISLNFKETTSGSYSTTTYTTASPGLSVGTTSVGSYTHNIIYQIPVGTHGDDNHGFPRFQFKLKDQAGNLSTLQSAQAQTGGEAPADVEVKEYTETDMNIPAGNVFRNGGDVAQINDISFSDLKNYMLNLEIPSGHTGTIQGGYTYTTRAQINALLLPSSSSTDKILSWTYQTNDTTLDTSTGTAYFKKVNWTSAGNNGWTSGGNGYTHNKPGHVPPEGV